MELEYSIISHHFKHHQEVMYHFQRRNLESILLGSEGIKQVWILRQQIKLHFTKLEVYKESCSTSAFFSSTFWIVNCQSYMRMTEFWTFAQITFSLMWVVKLLSPVKNIHARSTFTVSKMLRSNKILCISLIFSTSKI